MRLQVTSGSARARTNYSLTHCLLPAAAAGSQIIQFKQTMHAVCNRKCVGTFLKGEKQSKWNRIIVVPAHVCHKYVCVLLSKLYSFDKVHNMVPNIWGEFRLLVFTKCFVERHHHITVSLTNQISSGRKKEIESSDINSSPSGGRSLACAPPPSSVALPDC